MEKKMEKMRNEIVGKRVYLPIYMIMFLENTELKNTIYKIDLGGLGE